MGKHRPLRKRPIQIQSNSQDQDTVSELLQIEYKLTTIVHLIETANPEVPFNAVALTGLALILSDQYEQLRQVRVVVENQRIEQSKENHRD